jgi:hypothetical protein
MKQVILRAVLCGALAVVAQQAQANPVIYSQPPASPIDGTWASQNDIGGLGNFATVYDDFTLGFHGLVTDVEWQGQYFNPATTGTITAFTLTFWDDNANQPGAALLSQTIAGNAGETFAGTGSFGPAYNYATNLTTPFVAFAGTKYWLSIVPDLTFPPQWGWNIASFGNSYQDFQGTRFNRGYDEVYSLTGQEVPEPATMTLFGIGMGVAALRRRRKAA